MTDQTVGLPTGSARLARLRSGAARLLQRLELSPRTAWALTAVVAVVLTRHFWVDEGDFPNILFTVAVTLALAALAVLLSAPGVVRNRPDGVAGRRGRRRGLGQARDHEHGRARLRPLLLSRAPGRRSATSGATSAATSSRSWSRSLPQARWAGSPIASTPPACPAAAPPWRCCSASASPGTAPTPRASGATCSSTTRTSMSRRSTRPGARRSRRCGAERCWRRRRARPWRGQPLPSRPRAGPRPSRRTSS